jgi:hypothetical protein
LAELEWDYEDVPDGELVACCYWEYARESAFIRATLHSYRKKWFCPGGKLNKATLALWNEVSRIQSIGYAAEVFVRGCTFKPDRVWQSEDRDKPNYRHPNAPPITGSFPAPWQSLSQDERECRAHIRSNVEEFQIVPVRVSDCCWAKEIARHCQGAADQRHEQLKEWDRRYLSRDEKGNYFTLPNAPDPPQFGTIRPRILWGLRETLMVDIAWECFTNDEIASYFRKWVKVARPIENPCPNGKGQNKARDWRVALERLAMMRLLNRFRLRDLSATCPKAWKRYGKREWYKERRRAGEMFRRLFPFLRMEERPLSWPTKGGRSKL